MNPSAREAILLAAREAAMARGYGGLNYRDLAETVGIKAASIHYHFPGKADLGEAVARRYWEQAASDLQALVEETPDPLACLHRYPEIFRRSLQRGNRMCLGSFMGAETDEIPEAVQKEVRIFVDINVAWLNKRLIESGVEEPDSETRARAIHAAVAGAQLIARSRSDLALFDVLIEGFRKSGPLPA